ncbi:hypothetical protein [Brevundimonas sp.]|uniref:hypothetical protein n=1 Tax=Brevundimonas sp. TaxID=1871086 RepID=UPI0035B1C6D8
MFKRLTPVEADSSRSNQHEFNASPALRAMFGPDQPQRFDADFVWMPDDGEFVSEAGSLTWYDARARHPTRSEYRLYYRDNAVTGQARAGDLLLIGRRPDGRVLVLLSPGTGRAAERIAWLFGMEERPGAAFSSLGSSPGFGGVAEEVAPGYLAGPEDTGWESEAPTAAPVHDPAVRDGARALQGRFATRGHDPAGADWESAGPSDDDAAMSATVRGVLRPGGS